MGMKLSGSLNFTGSIITTLGITGPITATNGVISSSQQITDLGFISSSTADTTQLNIFSGSLNTYTSSNNTILGRIWMATSSLNTYTSSNDSILNRIWIATSSLNTYTSSNNLITTGLMAYTASLKSAGIVSSSTQIQNYYVFAQTASANTFYGTQVITGSLFVSSTAISDATLLANNSNLTLTSGSSIFVYNTGSIHVSGSVFVTSSLMIGTGSFDTTAPESLLISQPTGSSYNTVAIKSNVNNYSQLYITNLNAGISASSDLVVQANNGNQTNMFADLGVNSSGYTGNGNGIGKANDAYVYGKAKDFWVGNNTTASLHLFANTSGTPDITIVNKITNITGSLIVSASTNLTGSVTINNNRIDDSWTAYTPQWTAASSNPVINNGTIQGYYKVVGKTCFVRGNIAMGSTTTFGSGEWYVSMPFTASNADGILMTATLLDNSTAWYNAILNGARAGFSHKSAIQYQVVGGTADSVTPTTPFTWTTSDRFIWNGSYEIA